MNFEEFEDKFKPLNNHIAEANNPSGDGQSHAPMGGIMFETYGEELAFAQAQDPNNVWTVIVTDETPYDEFVDNYSCDDCEDDFCTCGEAQEKAIEQGLEPVWYICKGFHIVNRHGYIITEKPWTDDDEDAEY